MTATIDPPARSSRRLQTWGGRALLTLALLTVIVLFGAPFLWLAAAALDRSTETSLVWPRDPTLANFRALFDDHDIGPALRTSLVVSLATMAVGTVASSLAGYGLSRMGFRRKSWVAYAILLLQTIPLPVTLVAIYDLALRLRLQDTYRGLILTHVAISLPFLVWLMKGHCDAVPRDVEEAAWLDGASPFRAWLGVVVPQTLAGLAVAAGFAFAYAWAEVLMSVVILSGFGMRTLQIAFFDLADANANPQVTAALGVLYILPVLLVFLLLRRLMIRGLVEGTHGL
jgi:ABC-type glycerol-3-phosphate transport system permease component